MPDKPMTITLPPALARKVRARMAAGGYASEAKVIGEGLLALEERDPELDHWLRNEGAARFKASLAGKAKAVSAAEAFARVKGRIGKRVRAK